MRKMHCQHTMLLSMSMRQLESFQSRKEDGVVPNLLTYKKGKNIMSKYRWNRCTAASSFQQLLDGKDEWYCHSSLLEDWRRSDREDRLEIVSEPIPQAWTVEHQEVTLR